ncbi:MAG: Hydroxyacylglutathione hydrolase GloC [Anaerolineae bacterium]|nr:Hydroxyacylglutathione hydrolase GloC [Anaerolineae bacterium]
MLFQMMQVGPLGVNCYIVGDETTREVLVIDPGGHARQIHALVETLRARVVGIVLTHAHFDHVMGVEALKRATLAPLYVGANEKRLLENVERQGEAFGIAVPPAPEPEHWLMEGDVVRAGNFALQVLDVPGHSPGSIALYNAENGIVFVGDVLMRGTIGRTDFPDCSFEELLKSIRTKLYTLPDATQVYSGHGPMTTIGEEKLLNPFTKNYV